MFDWVLNTPFMCNANELISFCLIQFLTEKFFQKGWILIPINPRNMTKLHAKKIYTKYDKICLFQINPHENYNCEKKS